MRMLRTIPPIVLLLSLMVMGQGLPTKDDPELRQKVLAALEAEDPRPSAGAIWGACVLRHGTIDVALGLLGEFRKDAPAERVDRASRLEARLLRFLGDLPGARLAASRIPEDRATIADLLEKAEVLDALGQNKPAQDAYGALLQRTVDDALRTRVLLRLALMEDGRPSGDGASPLAAFAAAPDRAPDLRNQAAVVLALLDRPEEALSTFIAGQGPEKDAYREHVRLAEWAMGAAQWDLAQDHAWQATQVAKLQRDRRYALTILVEAYRRAGQIDRLIERFDQAESLDDAAREVWIDLLRETGRFEDALRLFEGGNQAGFTPELRRRLLEMCRETGDEERLRLTYQRLIDEEPAFVEWREGLSRYYLERGNRDAARAVWDGFREACSSTSAVLAGAESQRSLGLHSEAEALAQSLLGSEEAFRDAASLFLFELHLQGGRPEQAAEVLDALDRSVPADAPIRMLAADAWARLGDKRRAVTTLENLRAARPGEPGQDADTKLGFLYSEIGEEEKAEALWFDLWGRIESVPRRRYVEDRLMTVASRLGTLAGLAVRLETRLMEGQASERDAGLLVSLYTRANDPVSATEIIEEYMKSENKSEVLVLVEKARIFLSCNDFYNYDATVRRLIEIDEPENRPDHLRQLAMSLLERGKREEARSILVRLSKEEGDSASDEFEAGVLSLAGLREEALVAYRRGLARQPDRIDTWLLVSNTLKDLGRHELSAGMFQHLALSAERDDLFTIAIDGILNMRDGRSNTGAPDRLVKWARRVVLERIASRPDKLYLYQLVADLSDELNDTGTTVRALTAALPIAGEQRTPLLRELMIKAKSLSGRRGATSAVIVRAGGLVSISAPRVIGGGAANEAPSREDLLYGRRLLGQGELVPPGVYMELGESFLQAQEVDNAMRTFSAASQLPEFDELQERIAQSLETARYPEEALSIYERILTVDTGNVPLISKVAELHERIGRDDRAHELYAQGLRLFLDRRTVFVTPKVENPDNKEDRTPIWMRNRNVDQDEQAYPTLLQGLLTTFSDANAVDRYLVQLKASVDTGLAAALTRSESDRKKVEAFPQLLSTTQLYRAVALAYGRCDAAEEVDIALMTAFGDDQKFLESLVRERMDRGYLVAARQLIRRSPRPEPERQRLLLITGQGSEQAIAGLIPAGEAAALVLPLLLAGDTDTVRTVLRRVDLSRVEEGDQQHVPLLVNAARFLNDQEIALGLLRHWTSSLVTHGKPEGMYSEVGRLLRAAKQGLDAERFRSLVEGLIQAVVEKPDRFTYFVNQLPDLQKDVGSDILTAAQVEALIRSRLEATDRGIYGLWNLLQLLPAAERSTVLRSIWSRVPKAGGADFLIGVVPHLDPVADPGCGEFVIATFRDAVRDVEDPESLHWQSTELYENDPIKNPEIALGLLRVLAEREASWVPYQAGIVLCEVALGRTDMVDQGLDVWKKLITGEQDDYQWVQTAFALNTWIQKAKPGSQVALIESLEREKGPSTALTRARLGLVPSEDPAQREAVLRSAIEKHPDDTEFAVDLSRVLKANGKTAESLDVLQTLLEKNPETPGIRAQLVGGLRQSREPFRALQARRMGQKSARRVAPSKSAPAVKKPPTPVPSVTELKKALDQKDGDRARSVFRQMWRQWPRRGAMGNYVSPPNFRAATMPLPTDRKKPKAPAPRPRGGWPAHLDIHVPLVPKGSLAAETWLSEFEFDEPPVSTESDEAGPQESPPPTVAEVLLEEDFGLDELQRLLRAVGSSGAHNNQLRQVVEWVALKLAENRGRDNLLTELIQMDQSGQAGRLEYAYLFALLETAETADPRVREALDRVSEQLDPRGEPQLRRLARLLCRYERSDKAALLYRWCAALSPGGVDAGLLEEVAEQLSGDARVKVITEILEAGRPDPDDWWSEAQYAITVLRTWLKLEGPSGARQRAQEILERIAAATGATLLRDPAKLSCAILAQGGDFDLAERHLEVALCKLPPPTEGNREPWVLQQWTEFGALDSESLRRLLPLDTRGFAQPEIWFERVATAVDRWSEEKRIDPDESFQIRALLAVRLHGVGRTEMAQRVFEQLQANPSERSDRELWIADVARRIGREAEADQIERDLFEGQALQPERVPGLVAEALRGEGPQAALALGRRAAAHNQHPALLATVALAAHRAGRTPEACAWAVSTVSAVVAEEALKRLPMVR